MPFHPAGEQPQTACPECSRTKDDPTHKRMFPIRGFERNEHDPVIPMDFFQCPPTNLEGDKMDNLRVSDFPPPHNAHQLLTICLVPVSEPDIVRDGDQNGVSADPTSGRSNQ